MKYLIAIPFLLLLGCGSKTKDFRPEAHLTPQQQVAVMDKIIRYVAEAPKKVTPARKFDARYDSFYQQQVARHQLMSYFISAEGEHFFLVRRRAPSLYEKYVATGGRFRMNAADSLVEYEEVFRTWKMVPDTLNRRALLLFEKMVKGESLEKYQTRFSSGVEFIEFPDEFVWYDKKKRQWSSTRFGSVEEMVFVAEE